MSVAACDVFTCTLIVGISNVCNHFVVSQNFFSVEGSIGPTMFCHCSEHHLGILCIKQNIAITLFSKSISVLFILCISSQHTHYLKSNLLSFTYHVNYALKMLIYDFICFTSHKGRKSF